MGKKKKRKTLKKKSGINYKLGCIITIIVLIPVMYGAYLYFRQSDQVAQSQSQSYSQNQPQHQTQVHEPNQPEKEVQPEEEVQPETKPPHHTAPTKDLDIPLSLILRQEQIIRHTGYTVSYNKDLKLPNWVSYELTRQETKGKEKRSNRFIADPLVKGYIATNEDYARSGYDKGHMAPAADMKWSAAAMKESFYFSNMCPQHPQLNRRGWKKLEEKIRDQAMEDSAIIIICGPILKQPVKTIGKNKVAVPQRFFKVVLSPYVKPMRAMGFLFNNAQAVEPLSTYAVSIDSIEKLTNLDFFAPLPDEIENKIEAEENYFRWAN